MSYQDTLDKKECIRKAKKELDEFSDLFKLFQSSNEISSIQFDKIFCMVKILNYDQILVKKLDRKENQLKYIKKMLDAIEKLDIEEIQLIYLRYINNDTYIHIARELDISVPSLYRKLNDAYLSLSLILGIEIYN